MPGPSAWKLTAPGGLSRRPCPRHVKCRSVASVWLIGAASPQTGQAEAILSPVLNTAIINQFLDQFSCALAPDVHAALIWDGAGFHRAHDRKVPANVTLIPLPPYSPELNNFGDPYDTSRGEP